ncbi:hypothetical protein [Reticulibacter mediterranei]|nr:hypothetical protein [Reticulibacter mediterranei]
MKQLWKCFALLLPFLVLLAACGNTGGTSNSSGPQTINVNLSEFKIDASLTTFTPGKTYHFAITNRGQTVHEFMIMPKAEGNMSGMAMGNMDKMALAAVDNISPGETKMLDYTFPASTANSQPEFACYLPGHYEAGMKQEAHITS